MSTKSTSRRQFFRRAGGTLVAGIGLALVPTGLAHASSASRSETGKASKDGPPAHPDVCSVQCTLAQCGASVCAGNSGGPNLYHCSGCGGSYYACFSQGCVSSFCDCQNCC
jgi:hypothetical protein